MQRGALKSMRALLEWGLKTIKTLACEGRCSCSKPITMVDILGLLFCVGPPKCCTFQAFRAWTCWIFHQSSWNFQVSFFFCRGGEGFFRLPCIVIYTFWTSTQTGFSEDSLQWPSWAASALVQWPSEHVEFPMLFLDDVKQTCWISYSPMCLRVANDWTSKALQAFVCIGHLEVLNILVVCAATL